MLETSPCDLRAKCGSASSYLQPPTFSSQTQRPCSALACYLSSIKIDSASIDNPSGLNVVSAQPWSKGVPQLSELRSPFTQESCRPTPSIQAALSVRDLPKREKFLDQRTYKSSSEVGQRSCSDEPCHAWQRSRYGSIKSTPLCSSVADSTSSNPYRQRQRGHLRRRGHHGHEASS